MGEPVLTPERLANLREGGAKTRAEERAETLGSMKPTAQGEAYRPRVLYGKRSTFWPRGDAAAARIFRILEGVAKSGSMETAVNNAQYKGLAKRYAEAWVYYTTRSKPPPIKGADHNPFRYLSDVDAERKFIRIVEDICDASTGVLGGWWVK